jgi:hypothetical protein
MAVAFRLAKFSANQVRAQPILVKLRSVWDKRLILSNTRKFFEINEYCRVGIVPNELLDVRRKNTIKCLYNKAISGRKNASMSPNGDSLYIDDESRLEAEAR